MISLPAFVDRVLVAAEDDWLGVWELPWIAQSVGGATTPEEVRKLSLAAIREALDAGLVEVGDVTEVGFRPWQTPPSEACSRIEAEWIRLPNGPKLGDMSCWFNLTATGKKRIEQSGRARDPKKHYRSVEGPLPGKRRRER